MKRRYFLVLTINLVFLILLLDGLKFLSSVKASLFATAPVLIEAVHYDGYSYLESDEAVAIRNLSSEFVEIGGWALSDGSASPSKIALGTSIPPYELLWLARDVAAFEQQFGFEPDASLTRWPGFANAGDEVLLMDSDGNLVDAVVYGEGEATIAGWSGAAVQPYTVRGVFGKDGQILYRMPDEMSGLPASDSNSAADWAQASGATHHTRRVRYPGWDLEEFFFPVHTEEPASLTIAISPDNALESILTAIDNAKSSIQITSLTFENRTIAQSLVDAASRGLKVRVLLEGSPVGGITDQEKAVCQKIEAAGGACWFMVSDQEERIYDRYQFMHAKYMIIDSNLAVISSENLSPDSMPADDKNDGTWGRRGVILMTDAQQIVSALEAIFARDLDPASHRDLLRWRAEDPKYGAPPLGLIPVQNSGGVTYTVRFPQAAHLRDIQFLELQQSPENLLRVSDGILGLLKKAGQGDTLLIQQLHERPYWGSSASNRVDDPNPRLEIFINAARRGATVRLLLDEFFDDSESPVSNNATCALLNDLAKKEQLLLECRQANPTGLGIHNKMILAHIDGHGYVQVGSWNGTELASKGNREIALLVKSDEAYTYLETMFQGDWPQQIYLPLLAVGFWGYADHLLISEILYDPYGSDATEFIEIVNPTPATINLGGFSIGDAVSPDDFEDVRRFPDNTILQGGQIMVISFSAADFFATYHSWPDFEIVDTTPLVAELIDDTAWGDTAALLQLGNQGDEVILRDGSDILVDVVTYGTGSYPGQIACPLTVSAGHSLERFPFWQDSDNCSVDMRDWPFPSPGKLP